MANFETSRLVIDSNITANGNQEISGKVMNNVLNHMVDDTEAKITELEERIENIPSGGGGEGGGGISEEKEIYIGSDTPPEGAKVWIDPTAQGGGEGGNYATKEYVDNAIYNVLNSSF